MKTNWIQRITNAIADLITRTKGLDDIHDDVGTVKTATAYTEASVSGATTDAWADALDVDTRGMKSMSLVVANTHGLNSLDYRYRVRYADYAGGVDEESPDMPGIATLAAGDWGNDTLLKGYSRVKVQVKSTLAGTPATYTIDYLINR